MDGAGAAGFLRAGAQVAQSVARVGGVFRVEAAAIVADGDDELVAVQMDSQFDSGGTGVPEHVVQRLFDGKENIAADAEVARQGGDVVFDIEKTAHRGVLEKCLGVFGDIGGHIAEGVALRVDEPDRLVHPSQQAARLGAQAVERGGGRGILCHRWHGGLADEDELGQAAPQIIVQVGGDAGALAVHHPFHARFEIEPAGQEQSRHQSGQGGGRHRELEPRAIPEAVLHGTRRRRAVDHGVLADQQGLDDLGWWPMFPGAGSVLPAVGRIRRDQPARVAWYFHELAIGEFHAQDGHHARHVEVVEAR